MKHIPFNASRTVHLLFLLLIEQTINTINTFTPNEKSTITS
jgi:hypothetical protein